jgi:pimeloyl-ACP methyl ester carboxylesterase
MKADIRKQVNWLIALVLIISVSAGMAFAIERDFGKVEIKQLRIIDPNGNLISAKLFRPVTASAENKLPAILNMHGYQNDKNVQDPFSIELAKRGFVVLAPDSLGHGDSGAAGLDLAGWFADPKYVMGNETALSYLVTLPFVDGSKIGVTGHSMGGMNAVKLPALFPNNIKAVVQQASSPANLPNILMLQARYDEFVGFRENQLRTEELTSSKTRLAALGLSTSIEWDTTYGNFKDGTARRMALIQMDHHFLPLTNKAVAEAVNWFNLALRDGNGGPTWTDPTQQTFMLKEIFGGITLICAMLTMLPLFSILLTIPFFTPVAQPLPKRYVAKKNYWWIAATINLLIGGILYPLTTQYGSIMGKIETWIPFMKMEMANGVAAFYLVNAAVSFVLFLLWYRGAKKNGVTMYDMGVSFDQKKTKIDWKIIGKTVLLGAILFAFMYLLEGFFQWALGQEFRFAWPFMRQFSSANRVGYFFLYLIPALLFFLMNGGVFLFGQIRQKEYETPAKTQWMWWLKAVYAMVTGLFLVLCLQYLPWLLGGGPGFEMLGLPQFTSMWPLMLLVYIPQFIVLFWFLVWFYRKTGRIYLGAMMISVLVVWFMTAGSIIIK